MTQNHDTGMTFNHGPCRPQQRVGNPLQQVVLTPGTEPADWPAQAAKRNTKRIVTSALSDALQIQTETELDNPISPVPATPAPPRHDCYIDQHGNCPAADTELCDLQCPYRDEK